MEANQAKVVRLKGRDWLNTERAPAKDIIIRTGKRRLAAKYLKPQELANRLNVGLDFIYRAIKDGDLEADPVGRVWRISEESATNYLEVQRRKRGVA